MTPTTHTCCVCGEPLEIGDGWWRCRHIGHPCGATLPKVALGELYARRGEPWAALLAPHRHGIPSGWRELARQRKKQ